MVQNKFDKYLMDKPFIKDIETKNKVLYEISNAITDNQKTIIRKRKASLLAKIKKGTISPGPKSPGKKKLTEKYIEELIYDGLENNPGNVQLIGKATDFFIKVIGKKDEMEDEIDMEKLKEIGIVIKSGG